MVYNGYENYIFISYAHADSDKVLPIVDALDNAGFRVWYDSGIEAGTEWPEYIEDRLTGANMVLVFMTPNAVESRNCRNEINFALELKKEMLVVYLEETTLLKGMRLQLNSTQSMFRSKHSSDESFIRELLRARILQSCSAEPVAQPEPVQEQRPVKPVISETVVSNVCTIGSNDENDIWPKGIYSSVLNRDEHSVVFFHINLLRPIGISGPVVTEKRIYNSANNLVFEDISEIQMEPSYDRISTGWILKGSNGSFIPSGEYRFVCSVNHSVEFTYHFTVTSNGDIQAGRTRKPTSPVKAVLANKKLRYIVPGAILAVLIILIAALASGGKDKKPEDTDTTQPTVEATQPATEPAPTVVEMSDSLMDFTVEIEGVVYQLPCKYQTLTAAGWTISSSGISDTSKMAGQSFETFAVSNNGKTISVSVFNPSGNSRQVKDCQVGGFAWEQGDGVSIKLAKGITVASTPDEIVQAYGAPNSRSDKTDYSTLTYGTDFNCVKFTYQYDVDMRKYSEVSLQNFILTEGDKTETNTQRPDYLDTYQAPAQLGTDYKSGVVKVQGALYQLPAPVSAFVNNGWKITQQPGYVMSGTGDTIQVERDGRRMDLYVVNFSDYQTTPENCAVYSCSVYADDDIAVELPGGISFQSTKAEVDLVLTDKNVNYYQGSSHSWSYSDYDRDFSLSIYADVETGMVTRISVSCKTWKE